MSVEIDMNAVVTEAGNTMGAQVWALTAELAACRAANRKLEERITELETPAEEES